MAQWSHCWYDGTIVPRIIPNQSIPRIIQNDFHRRKKKRVILLQSIQECLGPAGSGDGGGGCMRNMSGQITSTFSPTHKKVHPPPPTVWRHALVYIPGNAFRLRVESHRNHCGWSWPRTATRHPLSWRLRGAERNWTERNEKGYLDSVKCFLFLGCDTWIRTVCSFRATPWIIQMYRSLVRTMDLNQPLPLQWKPTGTEPNR